MRYSSWIQVGGIAVDWLGGNLYWTDEGNHYVAVTPLQGDERFLKTLVSNLDYQPRSITLDPLKGFLFWTSWNSPELGNNSSGIIRYDISTIILFYSSIWCFCYSWSWLDGTQISELVTTNLHWPNGLTVDYDNSILYWCDTFSNRSIFIYFWLKVAMWLMNIIIELRCTIISCQRDI